jgi:RND family efflux transporter MFP subunit
VKPSSRCLNLALSAALALGAAGCGGHAGTEEGESAPVPTIAADIGTVARQDLVEALAVRGVVTALPNQDVRVSSLVAGRVVAVAVAEGDAVRAGQVVARIDPRPLQDQARQAAAGLSQARAALESATANLTRTTHLFERGIAAGREVEEARSQEAAAKAAVEEAGASLDTSRRQLARADVHSPIAGRVVKRLVSVGEQVDGTAAQPVLEVANVERVELAANVPAERVPAVRVGQRAEVRLEGEAPLTGQVIAIAPAVDPATNAATARIRLPNPGGLLRIGMFAEGRIAVGERRRVLTVPPSAIARSDSGETAVYVVANGLARRTPVKVGLETSDAVELRSGVSEGQAVLTSGVHGLGDEARLRKAR